MAPRSSNRSVYLPDDLWAFLDVEAERNGLSVNGIVRAAVQEHRRIVEHLKHVSTITEKTRTAAPSLTLPRSAPGSRLKKGKGA